MVSDSENPCVEYEDVISELGELNKDLYSKDTEKNGIIFTEEDVLYGKLRPYLHNWLNPDFKGVAVGDWWVLRPIKLNKNFLYWLIQTPRYDTAANQSSGTKMPRADWKLVSNTDFFVPTSIEEQVKIAGVFDDLNSLITLHQRKNNQFLSRNKYVWEQRKLSELATTFEYGLNAAAKKFDGVNKYIRITDIDDSSHEFIKHDITSPDIDLSEADNYKLSEGDILFARTGASVGKTYIYKPSDGMVYYAGFLIRAKIREEYSAEFVFQNTLTEKYNKYIAVTSQRSGQPGVNAQEYAGYEIFVPNREEQDKISGYLRGIDTLITLHQCKCSSVSFF